MQTQNIEQNPADPLRGVLLVGPPGSKRSEKLLETARAFAPAEVVTCYSLGQLTGHFGLRCLVGKRVLLVDTVLISDLMKQEHQELLKALMSGPCSVELMHPDKHEVVGPMYVAVAVPGTLADLAPLDPGLRRRLRIIETPTTQDLRNIFAPVGRDLPMSDKKLHCTCGPGCGWWKECQGKSPCCSPEDTCHCPIYFTPEIPCPKCGQPLPDAGDEALDLGGQRDE